MTGFDPAIDLFRWLVNQYMIQRITMMRVRVRTAAIIRISSLLRTIIRMRVSTAAIIYISRLLTTIIRWVRVSLACHDPDFILA